MHFSIALFSTLSLLWIYLSQCNFLLWIPIENSNSLNHIHDLESKLLPLKMYIEFTLPLLYNYKGDFLTSICIFFCRDLLNDNIRPSLCTVFTMLTVVLCSCWYVHFLFFKGFLELHPYVFHGGMDFEISFKFRTDRLNGLLLFVYNKDGPDFLAVCKVT